VDLTSYIEFPGSPERRTPWLIGTAEIYNLQPPAPNSHFLRSGSQFGAPTNDTTLSAFGFIHGLICPTEQDIRGQLAWFIATFANRNIKRYIKAINMEGVGECCSECEGYLVPIVSAYQRPKFVSS
jgi:hypothetical protein